MFNRSLPCSMDMEISAGNIPGGRGSPPPHPPPSPTARLMLPSVTTNGSDIGVSNLRKIPGDHPLEDRGVDLSFDVKKETEIKTENCDIIKNEFKQSEHCEASMLQSPGGRLKIYKGKREDRRNYYHLSSLTFKLCHSRHTNHNRQRLSDHYSCVE